MAQDESQAAYGTFQNVAQHRVKELKSYLADEKIAIGKDWTEKIDFVWAVIVTKDSDWWTKDNLLTIDKINNKLIETKLKEKIVDYYNSFNSNDLTYSQIDNFTTSKICDFNVKNKKIVSKIVQICQQGCKGMNNNYFKNHLENALNKKNKNDNNSGTNSNANSKANNGSENKLADKSNNETMANKKNNNTNKNTNKNKNKNVDVDNKLKDMNNNKPKEKLANNLKNKKDLKNARMRDDDTDSEISTSDTSSDSLSTDPDMPDLKTDSVTSFEDAEWERLVREELNSDFDGSHDWSSGDSDTTQTGDSDTSGSEANSAIMLEAMLENFLFEHAEHRGDAPFMEEEEQKI